MSAEQTELSILEQKNAHLSAALTQVRQELLRLREQLKHVNQPPLTLGVFHRGDTDARSVEVYVSGRLMRLAVATQVDITSFSPGQHVLIDDKMVVVGVGEYSRVGELAQVAELIGTDRAVVSAEAGSHRIVELAGPLRHGTLRPGESVLVDTRTAFAYERVIRQDVEQLLTPEIPQVTFDDIGGLDEQITTIRQAIELPLRHPELYRQYGLRPTKGILLYGPPGSGKTLIAQALAHSLRDFSSSGEGYFLSIKGPELLTKFVGETERQIRAIFARARVLASAKVPVVIFFDEMEALFRTRGTGISSDVETMVVPQLLAEMDGVESLDNVVIVGASNRADMIDPAVLRPGRLDVRIRIDRPDQASAHAIFVKHLDASVPLQTGPDGLSHDEMISRAVAHLYRREADTALLSARTHSGTDRTIYLADIVSGAMIAGIVERAKKYAILDAIENSRNGLTIEHLMRGLDDEIRESMELATRQAPADWARTIGLDQDIVGIRPIKKEEE